ncbi:hypothetical protein [Herbaspirillum sp. NPDC087042]|uniref:hypothetical protein n=1 Tax=Herbaspirillum sp. NPDC087042 TaxID=3364004 RepID=UPI003830AF71
MNVTLFQISGPSNSAAPGFQQLVSTLPGRWGEFSAMRRFFREQPIDDESCYGFLAPDFVGRTGLDAAAVAALVQSQPQAQAWTFCPVTLEACGQLNLLLQGEQQLPGFAQTAQAFLHSLGLELDVAHFVPRWENNVLNGFVIARRAFWQTWFDLAERLHLASEDLGNAMRQALETGGAAGEPAKALLADRLASLVLALDQQLQVWHCPVERMPAARPLAPADIASLEQLRTAYAGSGAAADRQRFEADVRRLQQSLQSQSPTPATALPSAAAISLDSLRSALQAMAGTPAATVAAATPAAPAMPAAPLQADNAAAQAARGELVFGCMTHVPLPIKFPDYVLPIYLGESQHDGALNLRDLAPEWVPYHPIVAGMLGNFALRRLILRDYPKVKRVGVCLYRKFISRERISGVPAEDNWMMDVVSDKEFARESLEQMMEPGDQEFLVGKTCGFNAGGQSAGYLSHYALAHHAEDLLRFAAAATELGVFGKSEAEQFFNEKVFFMGGVEMGVFPAEFWLRAVGQIEAVIWYCVQHYDTRREGYQTRAWAFCAERLGSYLLLRELRARYGDPGYMRFFGQLNLITRGDQVKYIPSH